MGGLSSWLIAKCRRLSPIGCGRKGHAGRIYRPRSKLEARGYTVFQGRKIGLQRRSNLQETD